MNKTKRIFITGTDTEIGKTHASLCLLKLCHRLQLCTIASKPLATGCRIDQSGDLVNSDALLLQQHASISRKYSYVNPIALAKPIAPHLAASELKQQLTVKMVVEAIADTPTHSADIHIIEGIGGWMVPLNDTEYMSDVISALKIPVILVVAMRLGCLNHAILSSQAISLQSTDFIGWIANCIDPHMLSIQENITALKKHLAATYLGTIYHDKQYHSTGININAILD